MIQRIQSIWLLLAAACAALSFQFPFYSGNKLTADPANRVYEFNAASFFPLLVLTALLLAGCLIIIFLFKNRKLQLRLTYLAIAVSLINIMIYFLQIRNYLSGNIALTSIFSFAIPVLLFLAARGIRKDEKLVRSLDRLR